VAFRFFREEVEVSKGIGELVFGKIVAIGGALARWNSRMGLDQDEAVVEAYGGAVGASPQFFAEEGTRQEYRAFCTWAYWSRATIGSDQCGMS
jgi:hypothetical protein